jgi:NDP-sugar pyrophosphorylase family protein
MALYERSDVSQSGVARVAEDGTILEFVEKPAPNTIPSKLVNAGLLLWEPEVFRYLHGEDAVDFSRDVIPAALAAGEHLQGYVMKPPERLLWIDRPEDLAEAKRAARQRVVAE